jgi:hypothetical protein
MTRGKWILATAAILAVVVAAGLGGLTRAYAGVSHLMGTTTTVHKLCVYVDRTDPPASYGDLSVVPQYGHRTCIVGQRGAAGDTSVVTWNKTVATPAVPSAKRFGSSAHFVDLATVGPFTVRGYCDGGEGVGAITTVVSAQDASSLAWDDSTHNRNFDNGNIYAVSEYAVGNVQSPALSTEYRNGEFTVSTGDQATAFTGWASNGVYIQGSEGPACSFIGHLVIEDAPAPAAG